MVEKGPQQLLNKMSLLVICSQHRVAGGPRLCCFWGRGGAANSRPVPHSPGAPPVLPAHLLPGSRCLSQVPAVPSRSLQPGGCGLGKVSPSCSSPAEAGLNSAASFPFGRQRRRGGRGAQGTATDLPFVFRANILKRSGSGCSARRVSSPPGQTHAPERTREPKEAPGRRIARVSSLPPHRKRPGAGGGQGRVGRGFAGLCLSQVAEQRCASFQSCCSASSAARGSRCCFHKQPAAWRRASAAPKGRWL